jgi:beta-lactamase superfamily II metal-dependent hydrolase
MTPHRPPHLARALAAIALALTLAACASDGRAQGGSTPPTGFDPTTPTLELHFLDVGQGTSVLVRSPQGHAVLYDAGEHDANVVGQLQALGVTRLDLVIASHAHADHIGGISAVLDAIPTTFYLDNGVPHTTATYQRTIEAVARSGARLLEPTRRTIGLGDASLTIVPPIGDPLLDQNLNGVGALIAYGGFRAFLGGDAEPELWSHWTRTHPDLVQRVHVQLASHHGSHNGDSAAALARLAPNLVVVQVGQPNDFGHPHEAALERYQAVGATVLRTDHHGHVRIEVDAAGNYRAFIERQP